MLTGFLLLAAVKIKGGNLDIHPIIGNNPKSSYKSRLLGSDSGGLQRAIKLQNISSSGSTYRFGVSDASAERLSITNSGNVGIGDTTPSYKLDVAGTARIIGEVTMPARDISFLAYRTGYQYITTSAYVQVMFDAERHDDGSNFAPNTPTFTAPAAGTYDFDVNLRTYQIRKKRSLGIWLYKNRVKCVELSYGYTPDTGTEWRTHTAGVTLRLATGDAITVWIYSSDGNYRVYGNSGAFTYSYFSGHRVY